MYATVNKFKVKSGREDDAKAIALGVLEYLKGFKGFISAVIYHDEETNEWSRTIIWETKEAWDVFHNSISPKRREKGIDVVDGTIEMKRYDVVGYVAVD